VVNATTRPLYPRERPGTYCVGGWVGPRAGTKNLAPPGIRSPDSPALANCCTEWTFTAYPSPQHQTLESFHLHAPVTLPPDGKPRYPFTREVWYCGGKQIFYPCRESIQPFWVIKPLIVCSCMQVQVWCAGVAVCRYKVWCAGQLRATCGPPGLKRTPNKHESQKLSGQSWWPCGLSCLIAGIVSLNPAEDIDILFLCLLCVV